MNLEVGARLGPYEIVAKIGEGGMGCVYRALDPRLDRMVALKTLPPDLATDPSRRTRLTREAKAVAALNHPNIVTLYSVEEAEGTTFLTMELVEGTSLGASIPAGGLQPGRFWEIAKALSGALAAAHDKGVVHRDLKPGNVMITSDGRVKVLDFGLAVVLRLVDDESHLDTATRTREELVGTVPYMSPEQATGGRVDARSDIFSLGIVLYEMATGRRPFESTSAVGVLAAIVRDTPQPPSAVRKDLPGLDRVLARCLEKEPAARYQTARELEQDLAKPPQQAEPEAAISSIAVLPFVDMSPAKDQEYFGDGVAEEIIDALAHVEGLRVVARTSAFAFRGREVDVREIGRTLNVGAVLEGSIRTAGSRMRITAQLIAVENGYHLWSEKFDRESGDIFAVQDEIAAGIVQRLKTKLLPGIKPVRESRLTNDLEAYHLYLKGLYFIARPSPENIPRALECFQEAARRDPTFALAHVGVATVYSGLANMAMAPPVESYVKAQPALEAALAADPELAEVHALRGGMALYYYWDWDLAESSYRRCFELQPGNAWAHAIFAWHCVARGRPDEAITEIKRAEELDPLMPLFYAMAVGVLRAVGHHEAALEEFRKAIELDPTSALAYFHGGGVLLALGRFDEARAALERSIELSTLGGWAETILALLHLGTGERARAEEVLASLLERRKRAYVSSASLAMLACALSRTEEALDLLDQACAERDTLMPFIHTFPELAALRGHPRFVALLQRLKLEPPPDARTSAVPRQP
jgi:serine/threonine-protein kinase